jgi:hypothetical protein
MLSELAPPLCRYLETEKKAGEMRVRLTVSVTGRSQITDLPADTQSLKGRKTWRNLPSIFLILHDFDYLPCCFRSQVEVLSPNKPPPESNVLAATQ